METKITKNYKELAEKLNLKRVKIRGDEIHASCPFKSKHFSGEDKHPSFSVNMSKGVFNCFTCNSRGTIEDLVSYIKKISISQACNLLEEWGFSKFERILQSYEEPERQEVIPEGILFYFDKVENNAGEVYQGDIDGTQCFIYPVRNKYGKLVGGLARSIEGKFHKVLWNMEKSHHLFGEDHVIYEEPVIIVEGPGDVFALRRTGYTNAVALMGIHVSKVQVEELLSLSSRFIVWLDKDVSGAKGMKEILARLDNRAYVRYVDPWKIKEIESKQDARFVFETYGEEKVKEIIESAKTYVEQIMEDCCKLR